MKLLLSRFSHVRPVRPHRRQPTRHSCPWDSPGKNTGVGCHFLLQCVKVKSLSRVRLSDPMDCRLSIRGIFQARIPEWGTIAFSQMKLDALKLSPLVSDTAVPILQMRKLSCTDAL